MTLVLTLLVRDEIDVIQSNLNYHLAQGIDQIIVTDNGSRDGTREVLADYERQGSILLFDEQPADFSQHRWVTRMARLACTEFGADWVINGDADELFVWRRGNLKQAFEGLPASAESILADRHDFVPFDRPEQQPPPIEMIYRKAVSLNIVGTPLKPKVIHRGVPDIVIEQGNHGAKSERFQDAARPSEIEVFHYPIRTCAQFLSKVRNGGSGYAINRELPEGTGFHKKRWYEMLMRGELEREFHETFFFDDDRRRAALASGELIEDRLAADRVAALPPFSTAARAAGRSDTNELPR
jgi:hypothetical protein